jgi:hypothetical protein
MRDCGSTICPQNSLTGVPEIRELPHKPLFSSPVMSAFIQNYDKVTIRAIANRVSFPFRINVTEYSTLTGSGYPGLGAVFDTPHDLNI